MAPGIAYGGRFRGAPSILANFQESRFQPLAVPLDDDPLCWLVVALLPCFRQMADKFKVAHYGKA
ncbi:MAG: hypothetical protein WBF26_10465 [Candidatus Sulfotelmatobacter sp.]